MMEPAELKLAMEHGVGWCLIPPFIMCREDLSPSQKILYGRVQGLVGKRGYCFATNQWLASQICLKKDTISSLLSDLQDKKLLHIDVIRDDSNQVIERRIYPLYPLPYENPIPPPLKKPYTPPKKIGEGGASETLTGEGFDGDSGGGSVEYSNRNSNNKNSFTNLPANGEIPSHRTMRSRTTPIPERIIPLPQDDPPTATSAEPTAREIGREIMKGSAGVDGLWKLLKQVRQVDRMPSGTGYWFQQCTLVGQMVTEQGIEQNRIMELISWLYLHHSDEFVPRFFDALEFRQKFFKLESSMLAAKRPSSSRGRHTEFRTQEGDRVMVGPNGGMAHCVVNNGRYSYESDRHIEA